MAESIVLKPRDEGWTTLVDAILRRAIRESGPPMADPRDFETEEEWEAHEREFHEKYHEEIVDWLSRPHFFIRDLVLEPNADGVITIPRWTPHA